MTTSSDKNVKLVFLLHCDNKEYRFRYALAIENALWLWLNEW